MSDPNTTVYDSKFYEQGWKNKVGTALPEGAGGQNIGGMSNPNLGRAGFSQQPELGGLQGGFNQGNLGGGNIGAGNLGAQGFGQDVNQGLGMSNFGGGNLGGGNLGVGQGFQQGLGSNLASGTLGGGNLGVGGVGQGFQQGLGTGVPLSGQSLGPSMPLCTATYEKPAVVQQVLHRSVVEEVQPIIQREREQTEIHQIIAPLFQREDRPAIVTEKCLPAETRPVIFNAPNADFQNRYELGLPKPLVQEVPVEMPQRVMKQPIVQEMVKRNIVEEIHPILHKDIYQPQIVKETLPIYEKIVEPPVLVREERAAFQLSQGQALPKFGQGVGLAPSATAVMDVGFKRAV
jgi:hypothetical protein